MPLEKAFFIPDLDSSNPLGGDQLDKCDNQIRLVKSVLKNNFPLQNGRIEMDGKLLGRMEKLFELDSVVGWIYLLGSYLPTKTYSYNSIVQSVLQMLFIKEDGKLETGEPLVPLGFIIKSMLTQDQMDDLYGDGKFSLCDGTDVSNSKWSLETGNLNTPDFITEEPFPRPSKDEIGSIKPDSTGTSTLVIDSIEWMHNHNRGEHTHTIWDSGQQANNSWSSLPFEKYPYNSSKKTTGTANPTDTEIFEDYTHKHNVFIQSTDIETVPKHFYCNFFIRIN